MKPLILSFFAVILCYSLFFDRKNIQKHVDEVNYTIQTEYETYEVLDSALLYARSPKIRGENHVITVSANFPFAVFD
ncbi:MAG: hypothetical protein LBJ01_02130 [Tannerella sp.]|jgi:hypothetical protein|nr:hypothetical protein [Tannerella sp.]